jgi:hypothetical protein
MTHYFRFSRFTSLVLMHWSENKKRYALSVLACMGLLIAWFLFSVLTTEQEAAGYLYIKPMSFLLLLFTVGPFYASQYFRDLGSRPKAINFLLIPASTFEKLLCSILYSTVLFLVAFTAVFYLVDLLMSALPTEISGTSEESGTAAIAIVFKGWYMFHKDLRINGFLFFLAVQSSFLFGAVYFEKYSFIKTILAGFILFLLLYCSMYTLNNPQISGDSDRPEIPLWIEQAHRIFFMYMLTPLLWILTYFRLKYKQV